MKLKRAWRKVERNHRQLVRGAAVLTAFVLVCLLTSCQLNPFKKSESTSSNVEKPASKSVSSTPIGEGAFNGPMDTWSSEALRLSFRFPSEGRVVIDPDINETVRIEYTQDLTVGLYVKPAQATDPAGFEKAMREEIAKMPEYTGGFKEIRQSFFEISGRPAAYVEYTWQVMRQDFHVHRLWILKDEYQYEFAAQFLDAKYDVLNPAALAILNSIQIMDGPVNLQALSKEDSKEGSQFDLQKFLHGSDTNQQDSEATGSTGGASGSQSTSSQGGSAGQNPYDNVGPVLEVSKGTCKEGMVLNVIASEYGDKAKLADWEDLKREIGEQLPLALMSAGIQDKQAAWVARGGREYFMGNRHYFVQRFDSGPPADFWAHDQVGNMYLGSWYNIDIPVLVVKKTGN